MVVGNGFRAGWGEEAIHLQRAGGGGEGGLVRGGEMGRGGFSFIRDSNKRVIGGTGRDSTGWTQALGTDAIIPSRLAHVALHSG